MKGKIVIHPTAQNYKANPHVRVCFERKQQLKNISSWSGLDELLFN